MALREDIGRGARKLVIPAAASLAGAGAGLVLTRKSVREAVPDFGSGLGDIADDLRTKLDSVINKGQLSSSQRQRPAASQVRTLDSRELDRRLREREQRRANRRTGR